MMAGFMILGAILSMGKCSCLIAGCNMMNRGQKKQYDEQALCRFMGKIMYCLAFAMLIWLASIILQNSVLLSASLYFLVGSIAFAVIYAGTETFLPALPFRGSRPTLGHSGPHAGHRRHPRPGMDGRIRHGQWKAGHPLFRRFSEGNRRPQ